MSVSFSVVSLSRSATFCAGRRLMRSEWDMERNRRIFGRDVGPHGHEWVLEIAYSGPISPDDGMITNLADLKPILENAVEPLRDRWLELEVVEFGSVPPTLEHLGRWLWDRLPENVGVAQLHRLRLSESKRSRLEIAPFPGANSHHHFPKMKVSRSYEFAAAHRLFVPALSERENLERFDKCANPAGHGHNYGLEVWIEGTPDEETGFIIAPAQLDALVKEEVYDRFDHKHLNLDCPEFADCGLVPTSENLARVIFNLLGARLAQSGHRLARVGLRETQKNYFEIEA